MNATSLFQNARVFAVHLRQLRQERRAQELYMRAAGRRPRSLRSERRGVLLSKTGGRCHICGGAIDGKWAADHILAHAQGGTASADNYLPAHALCNNYRWFYGTEEFQWILKLGVWFRTRIEHEDVRALRLAENFVRYEVRRHSRRRRCDKADGAIRSKPNKAMHPTRRTMPRG